MQNFDTNTWTMPCAHDSSYFSASESVTMSLFNPYLFNKLQSYRHGIRSHSLSFFMIRNTIFCLTLLIHIHVYVYICMYIYVQIFHLRKLILPLPVDTNCSSFLFRGRTPLSTSPSLFRILCGLNLCRFCIFCHSLSEFICTLILLCVEYFVSLESLIISSS